MFLVVGFHVTAGIVVVGVAGTVVLYFQMVLGLLFWTLILWDRSDFLGVFLSMAWFIVLELGIRF